jgi:beta-glucosidase
MNKSAGVLAVLLFTALAFGAPSEAEIEQRVNALLGRMTLDEKIGQMSQSTSLATPLSESIKQEIRQSRWGSFLNAGSPGPGGSAADRAA